MANGTGDPGFDQATAIQNLILQGVQAFLGTRQQKQKESQALEQEASRRKLLETQLAAQILGRSAGLQEQRLGREQRAELAGEQRALQRELQTESLAAAKERAEIAARAEVEAARARRGERQQKEESRAAETARKENPKVIGEIFETVNRTLRPNLSAMGITRIDPQNIPASIDKLQSFAGLSPRERDKQIVTILSFVEGQAVKKLREFEANVRKSSGPQRVLWLQKIEQLRISMTPLIARLRDLEGAEEEAKNIEQEPQTEEKPKGKRRGRTSVREEVEKILREENAR